MTPLIESYYVSVNTQCGHGACIVSPKTGAGQGLEIVSLGSHGKPNGISFHDSKIEDSTCKEVL